MKGIQQQRQEMKKEKGTWVLGEKNIEKEYHNT